MLKDGSTGGAMLVYYENSYTSDFRYYGFFNKESGLKIFKHYHPAYEVARQSKTLNHPVSSLSKEVIEIFKLMAPKEFI